MNMKSSTAIDRIAVSLPEARLEHGLSQRWLAALSGVSRGTIAKVEAGDRVHPALLVRLGTALVVLDAYRPPFFDNDVDVLLQSASSGRWSS